tara:strand:- start:351 stop:575 length:225 start_codon:yes stop_codon:yes gene_type:complete
MRKKFLEFIYHWSSKLNVWAWNELYGKRDNLYYKQKGIINNKVKLKEVKEIMDDVEDYNAENDVRKIIKHGNEQ